MGMWSRLSELTAAMMSVSQENQRLDEKEKDGANGPLVQTQSEALQNTIHCIYYHCHFFPSHEKQ